MVTEYGVADLRGRTDEECIAALLNISDSRFQEPLLARALSFLQSHTGTAGARLLTVARAVALGSAAPQHRAALERMGLAQPRTAGEWLQQRLVTLALDATA